MKGFRTTRFSRVHARVMSCLLLHKAMFERSKYSQAGALALIDEFHSPII